VTLVCPSCGAPLEFRYDDSFVRVCGSCHSAIARTDRGLDTLGQFADLAPAASGLSLSNTGRWQGQPFVLAGRAEYSHPAGGSWEEWYLKLGDGRWAWLSHAQGAWALTFQSAPGHGLPSFDQVTPGMLLRLGVAPGVELSVGERNAGSLTAIEGELPFLFVPGAPSRFVDLSDDKGRFATLDYGPPTSDEPPSVYLGRLASLSELELSPADAQRAGPGASADAARAGERLACPNCGGSLELRVPERSLCVTCSYCGSLLDCKGPLAILERRDQVQAGYADIPLGAEGAFDGVSYTVTGRLRRHADYPGGFVEWDEYLLYAAAQGYRWLVCARGHYSFVTPLAPGAVGAERAGSVSYRGRSFRIFDRGKASVTGVWGEFYWKLSAGEEVQTADYIAPPLMLSRESSEAELHWSLGVYQASADVQRAFGLARMQSLPRGVAPHQPFRHRHWAGVAVVLAALLFACVLWRALSADSRQVYHGSFRVNPAERDPSATAANAPAGAGSSVFFTPSFELGARHNVSIALGMPLDNSWCFVTVDLVHEATGEVRSYGAELSHYSGVDGGESWSEGSRSDTHLFGAGHSGSHVLRLEVQAPSASMPSLDVTVAEDVFAVGQLGWVLVLLAVPGGLLALAHYAFERWRWSESDFAPSLYSSGSDD
jgi:Domain of unknown function (DUF4178)